jgi:amidase
VRAQLATLPYVANTVLTNVSGHPALGVPAGLSGDGMPVGVQLIARRGEEGLLLALAAQLEASRPDFWPGVRTP